MKNSVFAIALGLVLLVFLQPTAAQQPTTQPINVGNGGARGNFESDSYILKPGDKLEIFINSLPDMKTAYDIRVDGGFFHPIAGQVNAAGKTVSDLRSEFAKRLARELRHPDFRLGLERISKHQVAVLGEANSQGTYEVGVGATALDLLARAGGLNDKADKERAIILRGNEKIEISFEPVEGQGLTRMRPGDVLYIQSGSQVSVAGEVTEPGAYSVSLSSGTPWSAIIAAGGAKEEAALSRVKLIRPTFVDPLILDLRPESGKPLPEEAQQLKPGDIVVVPARQAVVLGAVAEPGPVPLTKNVTLLDVLGKRLGADSDVKHIFVVRSENVFSENMSQDQKEEYNLEKFFKEGEGSTVAVPINDGDLVFVPSKSRKGGFLGGGLGGILGIVNLARLFF